MKISVLILALASTFVLLSCSNDENTQTSKCNDLFRSDNSISNSVEIQPAYPNIKEELMLMTFDFDSMYWLDPSEVRLLYTGNVHLNTRGKLSFKGDSAIWDLDQRLEVFGDIEMVHELGTASCTYCDFEFDSTGGVVNYKMDGLKAYFSKN